MPAESHLEVELAELSAPICLTWELTYGCNLACRHCLSSSGRRDPDELTTSDAIAFVDEISDMGVFYVNIGGGEPTLRRDFLPIVEHAIARRVGVKFSTNGTTMTPERARRYAAMEYLDIQVSLDGAGPKSNDLVRGEGSFVAALRAMDLLASAGFVGFKLSVVVTRHNADELDSLLDLATSYGAELRLTRLRPSGRGARSWNELRPTAEQLRTIHRFLVAHPDVLTGDSFFHLGPLGGHRLPGLGVCGAGRVVCLVDPVGDVYACPFTLHPDFRAGSIRGEGGFAEVWSTSPLFARLRTPSQGGECGTCGSYALCGGGCVAAKFFTGIRQDGPDPECVFGHGERALAGRQVSLLPQPPDHSRRRQTSPVALASVRG